MRSLIAVVGLSACGRIDFAPRVDGGTDPGIEGSTITCAEWGPWTAPTPIAELNTSGGEFTPSLSPDGLEIAFASDRAPRLGISTDIWIARRARIEDAFSPPERVDSLSTDAEDSGPSFTADGLTIYVSGLNPDSIRYATRETLGGAFGPMTEIVSDGDVSEPDISNDELEIFYEIRTPTPGGSELGMMVRADRATPFDLRGATPLPGFDDPDLAEGFPCISPDGRELYFSTRNPGQDKIYVATRSQRGAPFSAPTLVPALEGDIGWDSDPDISIDERTMVFGSNRSGGQGDGDLYQSTRACLR